MASDSAPVIFDLSLFLVESLIQHFLQVRVMPSVSLHSWTTPVPGIILSVSSWNVGIPALINRSVPFFLYMWLRKKLIIKLISVIKLFRSRSVPLEIDLTRRGARPLSNGVLKPAKRFSKYDSHPGRTINRYRARSRLQWLPAIDYWLLWFPD